MSPGRFRERDCEFQHSTAKRACAELPTLLVCRLARGGRPSPVGARTELRAPGSATLLLDDGDHHHRGLRATAAD